MNTDGNRALGRRVRPRSGFWAFSRWDFIGIWDLEFEICGAGIRRLKTVLLALLVVASLIDSTAARAATNVSDCTEDALRSALALGGSVIFTNDCSITLSDTITITNNVTLNGAGHTVTISGGDGVRIFTVQPGATLVLANLILTGGLSTDGGALY